MIRKKQVITVLSVVTVAFLLGTVIMTAMGGGWREYLELWEAIEDLQEELAEKQAKLERVQEEIADLQSQIDTIELTPGPQGPQGPPGGFGPPDYDSGWLPIARGAFKTLRHNLGTSEVLVYLIGGEKDPFTGQYKIHQRRYGVDLYRQDGDYTERGAIWYNLGDTSISVYRGQDDWDWEEFRLLIWKIPSEAEVGWIDGTVTDADTGLPLEGAIVSANGFSDVTDAIGFYSIEVPPSTYDVTAEMTGYSSQTVTDISVASGETVIQDFALPPG